jgi:ribosomal protein S18 acetylase RimI-like enzyme
VNNIIVRNANLLDINNLSKCSKECLPIFYTPGQFAFSLLTSIILIAELDKKIIGYILVDGDDDKLHIMSIAVYKKFRRLGVGTILIKNIEELIKKNKNEYKRITLNVHVENNNAIEFYKKLDFIVSKTIEGYYEGSLENSKSQDAFFMEKKV